MPGPSPHLRAKEDHEVVDIERHIPANQRTSRIRMKTATELNRYLKPSLALYAAWWIRLDVNALGRSSKTRFSQR